MINLNEATDPKTEIIEAAFSKLDSEIGAGFVLDYLPRNPHECWKCRKCWIF